MTQQASSFKIPSEFIKPKNLPLSLAKPTESDKRCSDVLKKFIDTNAPVETAEELKTRNNILIDIRGIINQWVKDVCAKKGLPEELGSKGGKLFLSGSYRQGINQSSDDIDSICVVPSFVERSDFFDEDNGFVARLRKRSEVTRVSPLAMAKVPLIGVIWDGFDLDILLAIVKTKTFPNVPDDLLDDSILKDADESTVISLNGPRVTELLQKLVPKFEVFKDVLRCMRYWAKKRCIYSNKTGFLGGVNFGILVAFVCQLYPEETSARTFYRAFQILADWKWPKAIELCEQHLNPDLNLTQWDPERDRRTFMPIITPAYPCANSSYNVTHSTLSVMIREFKRAEAECKKVLEMKDDNPDIWLSVFEPTDFFVRFGTYVVIEAKSPDSDDFKTWSEFCDSQVRKLVEILEREMLSEIFPFPKNFDDEKLGFASKDAKGEEVEANKNTNESSASQEESITMMDEHYTSEAAELNTEEIEGNQNPDGENTEEIDENVTLISKRWFIGIRLDKDRLANSTKKTVNVLPRASEFVEEITNGTNIQGNAQLVKFSDMIELFPKLYPEGKDSATAKHKDINKKIIAAKKLSQAASATALAATSSSSSTSTTNEDGTVSKQDDSATAQQKPLDGSVSSMQMSFRKKSILDIPLVPWASSTISNDLTSSRSKRDRETVPMYPTKVKKLKIKLLDGKGN